MHDFAGAQEFDGIAHIRVVDEAEQVVVGDPRFLFRCKILIQIRDYVALDADIFHVIRNAGRRNGVDSCGVIHKIRVKSGFFDLFLAEIAGQLMHNRRNHFQMCQFFCTCCGCKTAHVQFPVAFFRGM